jgi:hypothetical protein
MGRHNPPAFSNRSIPLLNSLFIMLWRIPVWRFASRHSDCHGKAMDNRGRQTRAGGALLAFAILAGAAVGVALHQPSIGLLTGAAVGAILLAIVWWLDRR